jgi:hypothetical protein
VTNAFGLVPGSFMDAYGDRLTADAVNVGFTILDVCIKTGFPPSLVELGSGLTLIRMNVGVAFDPTAQPAGLCSACANWSPI